jgi:hypothetical protein
MRLTINGAENLPVLGLIGNLELASKKSLPEKL